MAKSRKPGDTAGSKTVEPLSDFDPPPISAEGGAEREDFAPTDAAVPDVPVEPADTAERAQGTAGSLVRLESDHLLRPRPARLQPQRRTFSGRPIIELFHVGMRYTREALVLDDVSLRIDKGEFVLLSGPSGAGKTTLLKLIFCAKRPTQGQIIVAGHAVHKLQRRSIPYLRRNIGVVFQDFKLLQERTVFDNIAFTLEVLGRPRHEVRRRVQYMLRRMALLDKGHLLPKRLSGGEQQRVAIARALINEPAIVLADEPTGNLDPALSGQIMSLLADANVRGTTVVVATHDPHLLRHARRRVIELERGRIVERPK